MGRVEINIPNRLRNKIALKGVLLVILIILVSSSTIIIPLYYLSEKHLDNSTHNINDLRGVSGLSISELVWDDSGDQLLLNTNDGISIVDDNFNYRFSLNYSVDGSRPGYYCRLLGIYDSKLFVILRISFMDAYHHSEIVSWDLRTQELVSQKVIFYLNGHSLSLDSSKLVISSNNSLYLIELTNPELLSEIDIPENYTAYKWINGHQIAFFYPDKILNYDADNHTTESFNTIPLNHYHQPIVISEEKFLFSNNTSFTLYDRSDNSTVDVHLEPRHYFIYITNNYWSEYIIGSVYKTGTPKMYSLVFWDTEGKLVDEFPASQKFHSLDWDNKKQKLACAGDDGNFTIFTLTNFVMAAIKNKNYLIPLFALILIVLIVYVMKKFVIRTDIEEDKALYPSSGKIKN